jgi:molecular chaperone GrpE
MCVLEKNGLAEIEADGQFDPELHEAVLSCEQEGKEEGDILEVLQKGYKVKDRIVRHSMVKVAK